MPSVRFRVATRASVFGVVAALVGSLLSAVVLPTAAHAAGVGSTDVSKEPNVASARLAAARLNHRIEVTDLDDASSTTYVNPNGTFTTESSAGPIRVARGGGWVPVDTTLQLVDGKVVPKAVPGSVVLSAGGTGDVVEAAGGHGSLGFGWPGKLPAPVLSGDTATYPNVRPGVDLLVKVTRLGYEVSLRLTRSARPGR